jgi:CRP/FNR family transcriptional regulator, cyclic AMP receptor protein
MPVDLAPTPPFLDLVAENTRKALLAAAETIPLAKGRMIFRTGDVSDGLYELVSGKVKVSRLPGETPDHPMYGHESLLRVVSVGHIFGELAVFDGGPRNASAVAVTKAVVRRYAQPDIERMVRQHPDLAVACLTLITRRLRFALERTTDTHIRDGHSRLIKAILLLGTRFGQRDGTRLVVRHDLTQAELGGFTGLSRETVSKVLADLAAQGLLEITNGQIVITDEDALREQIGPYT